MNMGTHIAAPPLPEALIRLLWDGPDAIFVTSLHDGRFLRVNAAGADLTGIPFEELIGHNERELDLWMESEDRVLLSEALRHDGFVEGYPAAIRTRSGEPRMTHVSAGHCIFEGEAAMIVIARDTTESSSTERMLAVEHETMRVLGTAATADGAIGEVLQVLGERLAWDLVTWWRVDDRRRALCFVQMWSSPHRAPCELARTMPEQSYAPGAGLPGRAWQQMTSQWSPDPLGDPLMPRAEASRPDLIRTALAFPALSGSRALGVVGLFTSQARTVDPALLETTEAIGRQLGLFLRSR